MASNTASLLMLLQLLLLATTVFAQYSELYNYQCKDGTMPTPMPCKDPMSYYTFQKKFFLAAWWLPPTADLRAWQNYADLGYNLGVSSRCDDFEIQDPVPCVEAQLDLAQQVGVKLMITTENQIYAFWTNTTIGGIFEPYDGALKAGTVPEVDFMIKRFGSHPHMAGILAHDDQCDMQSSIMLSIDHIRNTAPHLIPWMNNICTTPGWNTRVALPHFAYEEYTFGNETQRLPPLLNVFNYHRDAARKITAQYWPLVWSCLQAPYTSYAPSLYYFQKYAAIAYGAQGIWDFTYRYCMVDAEGKIIPSAYFPTQKAHRDIMFWGDRYIMNRTMDQIFHTGWQVNHGFAPAPGYLVSSMSDNVMVGVLTKYDANSAASFVAMVVDKRVNFTATIPKRIIQVAFDKVVIGINILYPNGTIVKISGSIVTLRLEGGEGMLIEIYDANEGRNIVRVIQETSAWTYNPSFMALTFPDDFKWYNEHYLWRQDSSFMLGATNGPDSIDANVLSYQQLGFTTMDSPMNSLPYEALNLGNKYGLRVYVQPGKPLSSLQELQEFVNTVRCHQALIGFIFQAASDAASMQELKNMVIFLRQNMTEFHIAAAIKGVDQTLATVLQTPLPMPLSIFQSLPNPQESAITSAQLLLQELYLLQKMHASHKFTIVPVIRTCKVSDSLLRFQAYASIGFGAQGLWFENYKDCIANNQYYRNLVQSINYRVKAMGVTQGASFVKMYFTGWEVTDGIRPAPGQFITSMSDDLLVTMLDNNNMVVVDKRVSYEPDAYAPRNLTITFSNAVFSIILYEAGCTHGFCTCAEWTHGNVLPLILPGGSGQVITPVTHLNVQKLVQQRKQCQQAKMEKRAKLQ